MERAVDCAFKLVVRIDHSSYVEAGKRTMPETDVIKVLGFSADNKKIMCYATPIAQRPIY
jgi:hypothetical protein